MAITSFYITMMDETTLVGSKYNPDPKFTEGGSEGDVGNDLTDEIFYKKEGYEGINRVYQADKDDLTGTKEVIKTLKEEGREDVIPTTPQKIRAINSILLFLTFFYCVTNGWSQGSLCYDSRQFYTKLCYQDDTSVFITKELFEKSQCLYGMSAPDLNGNEIDCKVVSFKFMLMRKDSILCSHQYDTMTLTTLDTLREAIKDYNITQGDILIFTNIKIKHPYDSYCYHSTLPMLKVIDNDKTYPRRLYMNVNKHLLEQRNKKLQK